MLRVKEEEFNQRERRKNAHNRRRRYSDDYDSEAELYQKYKAAGGDDNNMVGGESSGPVPSQKIPLGLSFSMNLTIVLSALLAAQWWKHFAYLINCMTL